MAAGTPVVATATDGAREFFITDENALVPIKDPLALADKICWFLDNDEARRKLGQRLEAAALEKYDPGRLVDAVEALYYDVVKSSGRNLHLRKENRIKFDKL